MSERDKQKAYIPWHERVDEELIRHLANQFVQSVYKHGLKLSELKVEWNGTGYEVQTFGQPRINNKPPANGETTH